MTDYRKRKLIQAVDIAWEDENYDMQDEFTVEDLEKFVLDLYPMILVNKTLKFGEYIVKVNNSRNAFVSVSNDEGTGVSRAVWHIFNDPFKPHDDEVECLLSMLNEAWFYCKED